MTFKWTEDEMKRVAQAMYNLATARRSAILEQKLAFKMAQSAANPSYHYSTENPNTKLLKELRIRVNNLFAEASKQKKIELLGPVLDEVASAAADKILSLLNISRGSKKITTAPVVAPKPKKNTRTLLTGTIIDETSEERIITITTKCPRKWVLVDLETGEQYSSLGVAKNSSARQEWVKPVRRVTIPKPKKSVKE